MRRNLLIPLLLLGCLLTYCTNEDEKPVQQPTPSTEVSEEVSLIDTLLTGEPIPIELKQVPIGKQNKSKLTYPTIVQANENIIPIKSPGIKLVSENLRTETPGNDSTLLPIKSTPLGEKEKVTFPSKTEALSPATTDAAYYNLQYLDVDQGLSSSYVMDILEDSRGNLWISTWATGVCVYDSRSFTNYDDNSGLLSNYIWSIFEDSKGDIWFGSDGSGIGRYDGDQFTTYSTNDGIGGGLINKIIEDERGNLWIATNNGLTKYDGINFFTYQSQHGLGGNFVKDICLGSNNRILIAHENGFSVFDGVLFTHYSAKDGLLSNETSTIFEDSESNIWIGTESEGVCMFDGYTFFSFNTSHGLSGDNISSIIEDSYGRIWIGTKDNGLSIYDRSSFTQITRKEGLSSNTVQSIIQDANLNIWIGTHAGINKYNERSFKNFTDEQGLGGLIVRGICEDQYGNLWFGHDNGVSKYTGSAYEQYTTEQGLSNDVVRAITQDHKGNIWFATEGGLTYYDGEYFERFDLSNGLSGEMVLCMTEDSDHNMWFGTADGGVTKYDGTYFYHLTMEQGLSSNTIRAICEDNEKNIWIGTSSGGLEKYDGENLTHYNKNEGLSSNSVLSLMLDTQGKLWIGTENYGINILYNDKIFSLGIEDGLSNGLIWSMVEDYDNNVWVGTEKGLDLIEIDEKNGFNITNFGKLDGLKGTDFYPNAVCLDSDNRIWWGTGKALSMLDLNKYERINAAPKLTITDVYIDQSFVDFRELKTAVENNGKYEHDKLEFAELKTIEYDSVYKFTNSPSNIEVPYNLNHLTIQFSANDWTAPHKIKYMHKLEGASNEWHTLTNDNKVVHSYLPEGNYIFHLKAIGEAERWSETIQFNITVRPPWWRTIWAYMFYVIFGITAIILITTWRTKKLIQQRKLLERLVSKRTEEVVKQKEIVELKNKEIIDSINYAKRIQRAILPSSGMVKRKLANAFILFKPKDIVAGDFYWLEEKQDKILLAAADCTGHGVPGAMVSLVCNNTLSRTVREFSLTQPDLILNKVRDIVIESFTNSREEVKDGMDIALVSLDIKTNLLQFAGANNNLYIVSDGTVTVLKADRQPIGKYVMSTDFNLQEVQLYPGDTIYMFTDGYTDQFGGPDEKKFKTNRFLELLLEIQDLSMREQKKKLEKTFNQWRGDLEQVDDVCVLGVRI